MENVRFVRLALHQGKAKKVKAAVTMVMISDVDYQNFLLGQ